MIASEVRPRVKICGITNFRDAAFACSCGADLLGFIFYKKSPRFIAPGKAKAIIEKLPKKILKVGVFVNENAAKVKKIAKYCGLDLLQFHGDETPEYAQAFEGYRVIKAFRVKSAVDPETLRNFGADYFLFDAFKNGAFGGTGKTFDLGLLKGLKKTKTPFFISGGLSPLNVASVTRKMRPYAVDVSSGVEEKSGKKDLVLVKQFIDAVKECPLPKRS